MTRRLPLFLVTPLLVALSMAPPPKAEVQAAHQLYRAVPDGFVGEVMIGFGSWQTGTRHPSCNGCREQVWRWASVTKQVVAVLIMQEVEAQSIALDAPAEQYLPGIKLPGGQALTVRHLLTHTSSLFNPEDGARDRNGVPLAYLRSSPPPPPGLDPQCLQPSGRAPGSGFRYNNCDFVVLGAILESVTGQSFATLVERRIAQRLGLKSVRVLAPGDRGDITGVDDGGERDSDVDPGRYGSAANLAGTSTDLLRFDSALVSGRLLGPAALAEMWRGDPRLGYAALGQWSYNVPLRGCATPVALVERRGELGQVQVRNIIAPARRINVVVFAVANGTDFGEPWQGKGLTYELLSAALCPEQS